MYNYITVFTVFNIFRAPFDIANDEAASEKPGIGHGISFQSLQRYYQLIGIKLKILLLKAITYNPNFSDFLKYFQPGQNTQAT